MPSQPQGPPEVFVSYSHVDDEYKQDLVKRLDVLQDQGIIAHWHDGLLTPGERWSDEIIKRLNSSRVVLFLISVEFLTSVYINEVEIEHASRRYQAGEISVIPVLVRQVHGWDKKPFGEITLGDLQALPSKSKFIKSWRDRDSAFAEVAAGIQRVVEKLAPDIRKPPVRVASPPSAVPTSHQTDYVRRHDEKGRDILEQLKAALAPGKKGLVALWGKGGIGKTRIAAEAATALAEQFGERIVWASAEKRIDFTFSTLLDEVGRQLGEPDVLKLAQAPKEDVVIELLAQTSTLVVLDNFETVGSSEERAGCITFLAERANCPSLITSRDKVPAPARSIPLKGMSTKEAQEFLDQVIEQTQDSAIFTKPVRNRITKTAESNPYIMLWMVAQIDEAQTPKKVLDELEQGKGPVAERVFERSFTLQQVGEDGRAALLALSLFVPDASHAALAEVAGFGADLSRVDEAVRNLRMLWLIGTARENERLAVEGLTRSLTKARLSKDEHAKGFRQRFIDCFLSYSQVHAYPTPENFDALEGEKDNVLTAMDAAFAMKDCVRVMKLMNAISFDGVNGYLRIRGYWDEATRRGEQALKCARDLSDEFQISRFSHNLAITYQSRGELLEARRLYNEGLEINKRLGNLGGIASSLHQLARLAQVEGELDEARRRYNESLEINKRLDNQGGIAITLHQLALLAQDEGEFGEARQLYNESLEIDKRLGDHGGMAITLHQLATLAQEQGEFNEARRLCNESLEIKKEVGNQGGIAISLHQLALLAQDQGKLDEARQLYSESLEIKGRLGDQGGIAASLHQLGRLTHDQGEFGEARRLYNESLEIRIRLGNRGGIAFTLWALGILAKDEGDNAEAARLFGEALSIFERLKSPNAATVRESLARVKGKLSE